jgi:hypothetical protein
MPKLRDLRGKKFGRLTPLEWVPDKRRVPARGIMRGIWLCVCSCGAKTRVASFDLTSGKVRSCSCLWREGLTAAMRSADGRFTEWRRSIDHGI